MICNYFLGKLFDVVAIIKTKIFGVATTSQLIVYELFNNFRNLLDKF